MSFIFISHATQDDEFVKDLRIALEKFCLPVWVDSRNMRGRQKLAVEVSQAIEQAKHFLVVLSPNTINSPWVRKEIRQAVAVEQQHCIPSTICTFVISTRGEILLNLNRFLLSLK